MLNIGHPLLENGDQSSLKQVFTERESCQKNPICNKWLDYFFKSDNPDLTVSHAADYDQSNKSTQNKEHAACMDQLKKTHGKN